VKPNAEIDNKHTCIFNIEHQLITQYFYLLITLVNNDFFP